MSIGGRLRPRLSAAAKDILAGLIFVVVGVAFAIASTTYQLGTPLRMGPGAFPLVLGVLLTAIGVLVIVKGVLAGESDAIGPVPWRALILILAAIVFFGLTLRGLGLVPTVFVVGLMSAFASQRTSLVGGLLIAVGLTIVSALIFVVGLSVRLPLIGPWIPL
jgi:hypothetical protein